MPTTYTTAYTLGTATAFGSASNLNSLANSAAKPLGKVNQNSTKAKGALLDLEITLASSGVSATGYIEVWLIESIGDASSSDYTDGINPDGTSDIASSLKNARCILTLIANANSQVVRYKSMIPVANLTPYWSLVVCNKTAAAFASSGNVAKYSLAQETVTG